MPLGPVVARCEMRASRDLVWALVSEAESRSLWWPTVDLDARLGGAVSEQWFETEGDTELARDASGEVDVLVEGHALGFRWQEAGDESTTAVLITLREFDESTVITVTETGFDALIDAPERAADAQESWDELLSGLTAVVEAESEAQEPEPDAEEFGADTVELESDTVEFELRTEELDSDTDGFESGEEVEEPDPELGPVEADTADADEPEVEELESTTPDSVTAEEPEEASGSNDDSEASEPDPAPSRPDGAESEAGASNADAAETSEPGWRQAPEDDGRDDDGHDGDGRDDDEPDFDTLIRGS